MNITVFSPDRLRSVNIELENVTKEQYQSIVSNLKSRLDHTKNYSAIAETYAEAIKECPQANPSDIWRHLIYRPYLEVNSDQSWKRAGGQALEKFFVDFYNPFLSQFGIRLLVLTRTTGTKVFFEMGILEQVGKSKLDIATLGLCEDNRWRVFGGIHVKASIAERITDDAPASLAMMKAGYFSGLFTLDMKAFPPPHGDEINRGELQFPQKNQESSDKRNYFERDGAFHACYSYNLRTPPTPKNKQVISPIYTLSFSDVKPDIFMNDLMGYWQKLKPKICENMPTRLFAKN